MTPNLYCEICSDAHGTRYVCMRCREDSANEGWLRDRSEVPHTLDGLTPFQEQVLTALFEIRLGRRANTQQEVAEDCGVGLSYVKKLHAKLKKLLQLYDIENNTEQNPPTTGKRYPNIRHTLEGGVSLHKLLINAAWREWRDIKSFGCLWEKLTTHWFLDSSHTLLVNTPDGNVYPIECSKPPRRFVTEELGYGIDEQPTLETVCQCLQDINTRALLTGEDPPLRVTYPLNFVYPDPHAQEAFDSDE